MVTMKKTSNEIWVFLSHSHEDYEKVRKVRDMLEDQHMRPLMFFLKCLNDHDEIDSLIKREIDCRTRFILCDSENARKSDWVKEEVKYIKDQDRIYETINVDWPIEKIKSKLSEFKRKATLFLSYSRIDQALAKYIYNRLSKFDFQVFCDIESLTVGDFEEQISSAMNSASKKGCIIVILNESIIRENSWTRKEIVCAIRNDRINNRNSLIPFANSSGIIQTIGKDENLNSLLNYSIEDIFGKTIEEQCDIVVNRVLTKLLTPGTILTHAHNFKNGVNCKEDMEEAQKLYTLYFKLADKATNKGDSAWRALGQCYEMGWGTDIDLNKSLECYKFYRGHKEDAERVIRKIQGIWNENTVKDNTKQSKSLIQRFLELFKK